MEITFDTEMPDVIVELLAHITEARYVVDVVIDGSTYEVELDRLGDGYLHALEYNPDYNADVDPERECFMFNLDKIERIRIY